MASRSLRYVLLLLFVAPAATLAEAQPAPARSCPSPRCAPAWRASAAPCSRARRSRPSASRSSACSRTSGPRQSLILARLEGGPLEKTGVIAGMSGSPVFVDGKLLGAVAYAFPFGKEPIAGITPIAEMLEMAAPGRRRAPPPRACACPRRPASFAAPLDRDAVAAALRPPAARSRPGRLRAASRCRRGLAGASLRPLALPLVFSGFDPATFDWARGVFSSHGLRAADGRRRRQHEPGPDSGPGSRARPWASRSWRATSTSR